MTAGERGFLLLTGKLADPERKPLTVAQFRKLAQRVQTAQTPDEERELCPKDLVALGYDMQTANHIVALLEQTQLLDHYLSRGKRRDCYPITRVSPGYPLRVRQKLGLDSPGSLVSGNARGADRTAQQACLEHGGKVISVIADELEKYPLRKNVLYISEDGFDMPFSGIRALSRNRVIHTLSELVLVAQTALEHGGSWDGTVRNLHNGWGNVCCFADDTKATSRLKDLGASTITLEELNALHRLIGKSQQIIMEELL